MPSLQDLHQEMERTLMEKHGAASMELCNYWMDCMTFVKENDLDGWKKRFAPDTIQSNDSKGVKRKRGSCNYVWPVSLPPCKGCKSPEVVEDVASGSVVCTVCGIIQGPLLSNDSAHTSFARLKSIDHHVIHRYSRVVYFRSLMWGMQGLTNPMISSEDVGRLRLITSGSSATPDTVIDALKKLKMASKYRRHKCSLAVMLSGGAFKPVCIQPTDFYNLLKLFRRIEYHWDWSGGKKIDKKRKVFLSYPYVFYQLCYHLDLMHLTGPHHLLQSRSLLFRQHEIYSIISKKAGLKSKLDVYR